MTRLFIRINTVSGSRTIITNDVTKQDAAEISHALVQAGLSAYQHGDVAPIDLKAVLKRRARAEAKAVARSKPGNVIMLGRK
jgi:hypothetical protein